MYLRYYVYAYLKTDGNPYYIGKGTGTRAWDKNHPGISVPKNRSRIVIVENNLSEVGALAIERRLISWYGRKDLGTGILRNKTAGGDMPPSQKGRPVSAETRAKLSLALKGRPSPKKGTTIPEERKERIKANHKGMLGKHHSAETKAKLSLARSKSNSSN